MKPNSALVFPTGQQKGLGADGLLGHLGSWPTISVGALHVTYDTSDIRVFSQLHFLVGVASKNKLIEDCKCEGVAVVCASCNGKRGKQ